MVQCEFCGRELDPKARLGDPKHIYNMPLPEGGHKTACKECFNNPVEIDVIRFDRCFGEHDDHSTPP